MKEGACIQVGAGCRDDKLFVVVLPRLWFKYMIHQFVVLVVVCWSLVGLVRLGGVWSSRMGRSYNGLLLGLVGCV